MISTPTTELSPLAIRVIMAALLADDTLFHKYWPVVTADFFVDPYYNKIASFVSDFYTRYGKPPDFEVIQDRFKTDPGLSSDDRDMCLRVLEDVVSAPVEHWRFYEENLVLFIRKQAFLDAHEKAEILIERGDFEGTLKLLAEANAAGVTRDPGTTDFFLTPSVEARFDRRTDPKAIVKRVALQMGNVDTHMRGGLKPKTLTVFVAVTGGGKMLALDTPIATPSGWTTMGALKVGDYVFDETGSPQRVMDAYPAELPKICYRVGLDDGSSIDACSDHLWLTLDAKDRRELTRHTDKFREKSNLSRRTGVAPNRGQYERKKLILPQGLVKTTEEIAKTLRTSGGSPRFNHAIPVAGALKLPEIVLPLAPYLFGLWLGDGTTAEGHITTTDVSHVVASAERGGFKTSVRSDGRSKANRVTCYGLRTRLKEMGVLGNKRIPVEYLRAARLQRLELLRGLMDTDGTVAKTSGSAEFVTTSEALAKGVEELIVSLGWRVTGREGRAKLYGKDCGPKWTFKWIPTEVVFRLPRKQKLQKLASSMRTRFRYIISCEKIPSVPMRCIAVEGLSHLYLAGRQMVPTHNTTALVHFGRVAVLQGQKVLHLTLELETTDIVDKYDSSFTGIKYDDLEREAGKVRGDFLSKFSKYGDALRIIEMPEYSLTPQDLESFLLVLRREGKFFPDVLLVDYADLMSGGKQFTRGGQDRRFELNFIYTWLHRIAKTFNLIVVTATQANRGAMGKNIIMLEDIAEDISKSWIADHILAVCQTVKERLDSKCRLFLAKNRAGRAFIEVTFNQDLAKCTFAVPSPFASSRILSSEEAGKSITIGEEGPT